jgi:hypothetical protein
MRKDGDGRDFTSRKGGPGLSGFRTPIPTRMIHAPIDKNVLKVAEEVTGGQLLDNRKRAMYSRPG